MKCPSHDDLLRAELGELTVIDAQRTEQHVQVCSRCRDRLRGHAQLLSDLAAPPPRTLSADAFTAAVLAGCDRREPARLPARRTSTIPLAICAAALAVCAFVPWQRLLELEHRDSAVAARGGHSPARAFAELFVVRSGVLEPVASQVLHNGDALAVRCSNTRDAALRLTVFAVDAAERVHWIFPAYVDAARDPESISIAPHTRDRLLDEVVEPDAPAAGSFRVFAVLSERPLKVSEVERERHALAQGVRPAILAGSQVQEWSTTWTAE